MTGQMTIDWDALREHAAEAMTHAYAPYSKFPVGAAALVDDGRIVVGCNVENASYGIGLCAECGLVSALHASGGGRLVAFTCVDGHGELLMPCGRCRQLLYEQGGPELLVETPDGPWRMADVLPFAFGPEDLSR
ncbi:putative cytidine deaminase Cdd [Acrocarpospora corrugata]|uniref:Cytidine deaminase n=1 Tax=Acrocarpospora corrugata TaxID=35763 RepID=A0A5M3WAG0_9ACTN|nr:cytidine deaminase [Acrocarpospora corrugata]GES05359.1 putative cytidine deaminase Cdd [Acrocarpospora corrugata]